MSFERAYFNCIRCYELAREDLKQGRDTNKNNYLYTARNDAAQALEQVTRLSLEALEQGKKYGTTQGPKAAQALGECMKCDFTSPLIAERVAMPNHEEH